MNHYEVDAFIDVLRKTARAVYIPVMRKQTSELLRSEIIKNKPNRILEIGTSLGVSGIMALNNCDGLLTTIDIDEDIIARAKQNYKECGFFDRTEFICGDCEEIVSLMFGNSYDFIILDGPKSHYKEMYRLLLPLLRDKGVMFVDDVNFFDMIGGDEFPEKKHRTIVLALREFLKIVAEDKNVVSKKYDIEDGVLIIEKGIVK